MKKILLSSLIFSVVLASCGKKGCTDKVATNFDSKARKDNNTCEYSGSTVFWFNKASYDDFQRRGVDHLDIFLNDVLTTTASTKSYFSAPPDCGTEGATTLEKPLGKSKAQNFRFKAKDPFGFVIYDNVLEVKAGTCMVIELGI